MATSFVVRCALEMLNVLAVRYVVAMRPGPMEFVWISPMPPLALRIPGTAACRVEALVAVPLRGAGRAPLVDQRLVAEQERAKLALRVRALAGR